LFASVFCCVFAFSQLWDKNLVYKEEAIGEVLFNLQPFFSKCLRDRQSNNHLAKQWLTFQHPQYKGIKTVLCFLHSPLLLLLLWFLFCFVFFHLVPFFS
jgi:hypothetical protein